MCKKGKGGFVRELLLVIVGGGLAIAGAHFNAQITSEQENVRLAEKQRVYVVEKAFDQRVKLIERTAKVLNQIDLLHINYVIEQAKLTMAEKGHGKVDELTKQKETITKLNSEFLTVVTLNNLFFGPKVKSASKAIFDATTETTHWWLVDEKLRNNYLEALGEELSYRLDKIN